MTNQHFMFVLSSIILVIYVCVTCASGDFAFASMYQDHMVLQMQPHSAVLWGYGAEGADVNVSFGEEDYPTKVLKTPAGIWAWKVTLKPHCAGGPHTITAYQINGTNTETRNITDVLFGDVWVCGGQSNMAMTVSMVFEAEKEIEEAANYPDIRIMTPNEYESGSPELDLIIRQDWIRANPMSVGGPNGAYYTGYSAVCWFFGRYLYDEIKVPVGLVAASWGATTIEPWTSKRALQKCGIIDYVPSFPPQEGGFWVPTNNSGLWNSMIHPLLNMTIKGAIWYQGESNTGFNNYQYPCTFPSMIQDWRDSWYEGTGGQTHPQFPFGFVQLSTFNASESAYWPYLRWHQTADYGYTPNPKMPNTFMAVAMDLGDFDAPTGSEHPRYKQDIGRRLVSGALKTAYYRDVNPQGPIPESAVLNADGSILLTYSSEQTLDQVSDLVNFEICCGTSGCFLEDAYDTNGWHGASITTLGDFNVILNGEICTGNEPSMVRYAWSLSPCSYKKCFLYNDLGLPAPPFVISVSPMAPGSSCRLYCNYVFMQIVAVIFLIFLN